MKASLLEIFKARSWMAEGAFPLHVNYSISIDQLLTSGGCDWKEQGINRRNFPSEARGEIDVEIYLISLGGVLKSEEVMTALREEQLRPATLSELLTFGAAHPDKQLEFPIAALGSIWKGDDGILRVPYLTCSSYQKRCCLLWQYGTWAGYFRFAALREENTNRKMVAVTTEKQLEEATSWRATE